MPPAVGAYPELVRFPGLSRGRIAHLHLRPAALAPDLERRHSSAFYNFGVIPGVILAAGRSSRFGRSKALLPVDQGGSPFVSRLVNLFRTAGVSQVFVVGRDNDAALREVVHALSARFVVNADADRGQLSSLVAALDAIDARSVQGMIVMPVDIPLIQSATIASVRDAFLRGTSPIARPRITADMVIRWSLDRLSSRNCAARIRTPARRQSFTPTQTKSSTWTSRMRPCCGI